MVTQLRTRTLVPTAPSESYEEPVVMDAPMGTSTDGDRLDIGPSANVSDDMGHSAKTHSSMQDDADETGHRSRSADVGMNELNAFDAGSRGPTQSDVSKLALDDDASSEAAFHDASADLGDFVVPKKTSRASSVRGSSPVMKSSPRYFDERFLNNGGVEDPLEDGGASAPYDWADSTEADGLGEISTREGTPTVLANDGPPIAGTSGTKHSAPRRAAPSVDLDWQEIIDTQAERIRELERKHGKRWYSSLDSP
ncbi:hypothetical protein B0H14DRAFT_3528149 [Mycena olivaceomarginata]|nr:hypothetical protein B0H14DRAFT_3528149 [Mycena olivaceomarginata]